MVIKSLNSEILPLYGFNFDGVYWVHPFYPIKLISSDQGYKSEFVITGSESKFGPTLTTNTDLLRLIVSMVPSFIQVVLNKIQALSESEMMIELGKYISQYVSYLDGCRFKLNRDATGMYLTPSDEKSYIIMSGSEFEFLIEYEMPDGIKGSQSIYTNPELLSLKYIKSKLAELGLVDATPVKVYINNSNGFELYFGMGITFDGEN